MRLPWSKQMRPKTAVLPTPHQTLAAGEIVGNYRIERQLGEGGMGAVYLATHTLMGSRAVVKVLLPSLSSNPEIAQRFINEARAASDTRHHNIVNIQEVGRRPNGQCFIGMEFLDGMSLADFIDKHKPLGLPTVVQIVIQIANGLHAAHKHGIVHRDMKPENVFVTAALANKHKVTILDFGCAKFEEAANGVRTNTAAALGTPLYMPPEQFKSPKTVDKRADVYALGAITWEMLVGRRLWGDCETVGEIISTQLTDIARLNPCALVPGLSESVGAVVARALARNPADRWKSAQAYGLALAATMNESEWGADAGNRLIERYAIELNVAEDSDADTEGVRVPPQMLRAAAPTMRAIADGAAPPPVGPVATPQPMQAGRAVATMPERPNARAQTPVTARERLPGEVPIMVAADPEVAVGVNTLGAAAGQSEARVSASSLRRSQRFGLRVAAGALALIVAIAFVVVVKSSSDGDKATDTSTARAPTSASAHVAAPSSALAIITEPAGASVFVDGVARGTAPVNVAVAAGRTLEVRAELTDYASASEHVTMGDEPTTVRLTLSPSIDAAVPPVDAAPAIDATQRHRDRKPPAEPGSAFDPDGVLR